MAKIVLEVKCEGKFCAECKFLDINPYSTEEFCSIFFKVIPKKIIQKGDTIIINHFRCDKCLRYEIKSRRQKKAVKIDMQKLSSDLADAVNSRIDKENANQAQNSELELNNIRGQNCEDTKSISQVKTG